MKMLNESLTHFQLILLLSKRFTGKTDETRSSRDALASLGPTTALDTVSIDRIDFYALMHRYSIRPFQGLTDSINLLILNFLFFPREFFNLTADKQ